MAHQGRNGSCRLAHISESALLEELMGVDANGDVWCPYEPT